MQQFIKIFLPEKTGQKIYFNLFLGLIHSDISNHERFGVGYKTNPVFKLSLELFSSIGPIVVVVNYFLLISCLRMGIIVSEFPNWNSSERLNFILYKLNNLTLLL